MSDETILLIEDDPDDRILILRALKKNGIGDRVMAVRDGLEALDYLSGAGEYAGRDASAMPQLILMGLRLPKVDGPEVLRRLRASERTRYLPVVVLTSCEREQNMLDEYGPYADSYVCRPVDFAQFSRAVRRLKPLLAGTELACTAGEQGYAA